MLHVILVRYVNKGEYLLNKTATKRDNDLTQGPVLQKLLLFALPTIAGNLILQLYNVVDSIVVGNFVGTGALAAVGSSFPIMMLFNCLFMGVSMGAQIVISQTFGAKDFKLLHTVTNTAISLAIMIGAFVTLFGTPLARPILKLIGTPADIIDDASAYLTIVFLGTLGNVFYILLSGAMRGMGDSRWPLIALIISALTNIVLDLVFVINFNMGAAGVAWATTIANFLSGVVLFIRFQTGNYPAKVTFFDLLRPDKKSTKHIFSLGLPSAVQSAAMSLGSIVIQSFSNTFGTDFIASNTIIMKADGFAIMPMFGMGISCTSFVGQNIGAGNKERAKKGVRAGILSAVVIAAIVGVILYFTGQYIFKAFGAEGQVLMMGVNGIQFLAFCYMFVGIDSVIGGSMRGAGSAIAPAITAIAANLCRIPLAYFLGVRPLKVTIAKLYASMPQNLVDLSQKYIESGKYETPELALKAAAANIASTDHYMEMFIAMGISMMIGAGLIFLYYKFGKWQDKKIKDSEEETMVENLDETVVEVDPSTETQDIPSVPSPEFTAETES